MPTFFKNGTASTAHPNAPKKQEPTAKPVPVLLAEPEPEPLTPGGKLALCFCFFNPCRYKRPVANALRFIESMDGLDWFGIELGFDGVFDIPAHPRIMRMIGTDKLWHKETLLNILADSLPPEFTKVAWIDADVTFFGAPWVQEAEALLDRFAVIQLFSEVDMTDKAGGVECVRTSVAKCMIDQTEDRWDFGRAHPGFAWAARRELFTRHGLFDLHITGGGDSLMTLAFFGRMEGHLMGHYNDAVRACFVKWGKGAFQYVRGRVGFLNRRIAHMWHGTRENRRYMERISYLAAFNPSQVTRGRNGLLKWTGSERTKELVEGYFAERNEDE